MSEQFKTYREFAAATLDDIYGGRLKTAYKVTANHLESGVWINESSDTEELSFRWQALPWEAQLSPINDIISGDFNRDGNVELILAQNHYTNWMETCLWRGSPGCHLEWRNGGFHTIPHRESGIVLPGDTKSLLTLGTSLDGTPDVLAGQNRGAILRFRATAD